MAASAQQSSKSKSKAKTPPKSKAQLERERVENLKRIQEANRILQQTKEKKEVSIGQLNAIQEKITVQKGLITNISSELKYINRDMRKTETTVTSLKMDLDKMKAEYAAMIYGAAKTTNSYNKMMFLFAAESFNQFVRRLTYLHQYSEARKKQVRQINAVQESLQQKINVLSGAKRQKQNLLHTQLQESKNLDNLRNQQNTVITQLSRQEEELRKEVERRQLAVRQLNNRIDAMVRAEIARSAELARKRAAAAGTAGTRTSANRVTLTPETALLSSSFGGNKGRFPWPVERGFISQRFGVHPHPVLRNVSVQNNGIEIQTNDGENARSIFAGKVTKVINISGMNNIVMIQHGEYFTVYGKLKSVSVTEGQNVEARQNIGSIYTNSEGTTELHFEIWRNVNKMNPQSWLVPK
ncbi:MAG: murein hydrolase activator EnvC family protein [Adhaeribacter sp.]